MLKQSDKNIFYYDIPFKTLEFYKISFKLKSIGVEPKDLDESMQDEDSFDEFTQISNNVFEWSFIHSDEFEDVDDPLKNNLKYISYELNFSNQKYSHIYDITQEQNYPDDEEYPYIYLSNSAYLFLSVQKNNHLYARFFLSDKNKHFLSFFFFSLNTFINIKPKTFFLSSKLSVFKMHLNSDFFYFNEKKKMQSKWFFNYKALFLKKKLWFKRNLKWNMTYNDRSAFRFFRNLFTKQQEAYEHLMLALKKKVKFLTYKKKKKEKKKKYFLKKLKKRKLRRFLKAKKRLKKRKLWLEYDNDLDDNIDFFVIKRVKESFSSLEVYQNSFESITLYLKAKREAKKPFNANSKFTRFLFLLKRIEKNNYYLFLKKPEESLMIEFQNVKKIKALISYFENQWDQTQFQLHHRMVLKNSKFVFECTNLKSFFDYNIINQL